jgi:biopolymer transport protein ExbD
MVRNGQIVLSGQLYPTVDSIKPLLNNEKYLLESKGRSAGDATIIIRAHKDAKTGMVQEIIKICQQLGFEKFTLRAKSEVGY